MRPAVRKAGKKALINGTTEAGRGETSKDQGRTSYMHIGHNHRTEIFCQ